MSNFTSRPSPILTSHSDVAEAMEPSGLGPGVLFGLVTVLIICALGLAGNGLSALILLRKEMRSTASYLLLGLTFSDTLILSYTVLWACSKINSFSEGDKLFLGFLFFWNWISKSGTKYFTVAVSLERYIAICHPFKVQFWLTQARMMMYTGVVVTWAVGLSVVSYFMSRHLELWAFKIYIAVLLHAIPLSCVIFLNLSIYFGIQKFQNRRKSLTPAENSEVSLARMLLILVLVYSLCCSFSLIHLIMDYSGYVDTTQTMRTLGHLFNVLNSSVNFLIYYLMLRKFRESLSGLLGSWKPQVRSQKHEVSEVNGGNTSVAMLSNEPGSTRKKQETEL